MFNKLDFPEPEGPIIEYIFPEKNLKFKFLNTVIFFFFITF